MKAETLKKAILQYAMQGKLVEQNPNDEPASELLKRIQAEKEELIKQGKIKKEKPLPPITQDEIPFELPNGWEWVRFGEIVKYNIGKTPSRKEPAFWGNDYNWVSIADMNNGSYINSTKEKISEYAYKNSFKQTIIPKETLIMSFKLTVGKVSILGMDAFHNEAIIAIFPYQDNNYIIRNYLFKTLPIIAEGGNTKSAVKGNTLNTESINNLLIPLPPFAEQQRIVDKLEEILPLVEEYGKNEEELEKLNKTLSDKIKQSILQHAVQGKLVPQNPTDEPASELLKRIKAEKEELIKQGKIKKEKPLPPITEDEIPFNIPNSWEWGKIRNIAFVTKLAGFEYTKYIHLSDGGEIPVIRAQNVKPFQLNLTNLKYIDADTSKMLERSALTKPCILMTFIGAGIGDVAVFDKNNRFHLAPNVAKIEFYNKNNNINNKYAMYYLLSNYGKQEVFKFLKATAQPSLSMDTIREVMIPIPPFAEQQRIVDKVEELMKIIDKLEAVR